MAKRFRKKIRTKKSKFITDKALVHFIHQHSIKEDIDFSKIKIPFFSKFLENEKNGFNESKSIDLNEKLENSEIFKNQKSNKMPRFILSFFNDSFMDDKKKEKFKFDSFIFQ